MIERFSEDIDLSVSHEFFGIEKTTRNQREKLRKKARRYFLDTVSAELDENLKKLGVEGYHIETVSYTHLRAHETDSYLVCRLLLEKKKIHL